MVRRYSYRGRYYGKRRNANVRATTFSRRFKASAANMTQNGLYNISGSGLVELVIPGGGDQKTGVIDIADTIWKSAMHGALSNVFDQYKIDKIQIKFTPYVAPDITNPTNHSMNGLFFTAIDRTGFAADANYAAISTYGSFTQTAFSVTNGESSTKPHYVRFGQTGIVGRSQYFDTKTKSTFPSVCCGVKLPGSVSANTTYKFAFEVDAQVRYRGVRFDGRNITSQ